MQLSFLTLLSRSDVVSTSDAASRSDIGSISDVASRSDVVKFCELETGVIPFAEKEMAIEINL